VLRWLKTVWAMIPRDRLPIRQSHRHHVQRSDTAVAERLIDLVDGLRAPRMAGCAGTTAQCATAKIYPIWYSKG